MALYSKLVLVVYSCSAFKVSFDLHLAGYYRGRLEITEVVRASDANPTQASSSKKLNYIGHES